MIGSFDNDIVHAKAMDGSAGAPDVAVRLNVAGQRCELVGNYPHGPVALVGTAQAQKLGRRLVFIAGSRRARGNMSRHRLNRTVERHVFWTLSPFGRNDHPLLGYKVLS